MKSIVFLISTAITLTLAEKLITVPFTASERVGNGITSSGSKKLADLIDVPLKNIDLAYLIDIEVGNVFIINIALFFIFKKLIIHFFFT